MFLPFILPGENTYFIVQFAAPLNLQAGRDTCLLLLFHTSSQLFTLKQFAFELLAESELSDAPFVDCTCSGRKKTSHGMCLMENKDVQYTTLHFNSTSYLQRALS